MTTRVSYKRQAAVALSAAFSLSIHAQTGELSPTVVTATRIESRADAVLSDVTVITREEIESGKGRTLAELISRVAGVQMAANGGLGKSSSIYIRGTENRHVLLLVDGVRVGSATTGQANFDNIPLESIERIEVLKGPASALYGSDAVGGVIQIFTRQGREGFRPYASATVGSAGRREVSTGLSGGSKDVSYNLGVQTLREKGFSATNPAVGSGHNIDRDGFSQDSLTASTSWRFAPGWKLGAKLLSADGVNHYDSGASAFDTHADLQTQSYGLHLEGQLLRNWKSRLSYGGSDDKSTNYTSTSTSRFDTHQDQWTWLNEVGTPLGLFLAGLERVEQRVSSTTAYPVKQRFTDSVFAGINGEASGHSWQLNARRDDNSQFGGATTGFAGYGYKLTRELRAHASYGTSFKAPTFNQLYFPNGGNAALRPEEGRNREVGLAYTPGAQEYKVVYFDNRIRDLISGWPPKNVDRARLQGWTLSYSGQFDALGLRAALDLLEARDETNGRMLPRRADEQLTLGADYRSGAWKYGATFLAASERYDNTANTIYLGGFGTLDTHVDYALTKDWSLQARINNLGDKVYQTANGYNQQGRAAYLTLRWAPR